MDGNESLAHNMKKLTFCINTSKNERYYLELLLASLLNAIDVKLHDIIIFVDSDNQNTCDMLVEQKELFPNLKIVKNNSGIPVGYAGNINWMFEKATTDIVVYLQSDMVLALKFDEEIIKHLTEDTVICATRVEPPLHSHCNTPITYVQNFGLTPETFNYSDFISYSESIKSDKITNYYFAPFAIYRKKWMELGGHDVSFKKSREDSDICYRLCLSKMKLLQSWSAIVYHFSCISSRMPGWWKPENKENEIVRQKNDQIELNRFIDKWGTFKHPMSYNDVSNDIKTNPHIINNIIVKNPPIDDTNFIIL